MVIGRSSCSLAFELLRLRIVRNLDWGTEALKGLNLGSPREGPSVDFGCLRWALMSPTRLQHRHAQEVDFRPSEPCPIFGLVSGNDPELLFAPSRFGRMTRTFFVLLIICGLHFGGLDLNFQASETLSVISDAFQRPQLVRLRHSGGQYFLTSIEERAPIARLRRRMMERAVSTIKDIGPKPQSFDIEHATIANPDYRAVAWSGRYLQVTLIWCQFALDQRE